MSILLVGIGIISVLRSFFVSGTPIGTVAWKGLVLIVSSTLLFGTIVRGAGIVIALPILVIVSAAASVRFNWKTTLIEAIGITFFCIIVFLKGLGVLAIIAGSLPALHKKREEAFRE